jgi:hypothetical protein
MAGEGFVGLLLCVGNGWGRVQNVVTSPFQGPDDRVKRLWHNKFSVLSGGHFKRIVEIWPVRGSHQEEKP